jgi:hypothetical protein
VPLIPEEGGGRRTRQIELETQRYLNAMTGYVACIQAELASVNDEDATPLELALLVRRNNAAVAEVDVIMRVFNDRVGPVAELNLRPLEGKRPAILETIALDDDFVDAEPVACLSMTPIQDIRVVDDRTVLFYRQGGRIYLNALRDVCLGLERNGLIGYGSRGARSPRLCKTNTIHPIEVFSGTVGVSCEIGQFYEISAVQAEALLNADPGPGPEHKMVEEPVDFQEDDEAP